MSNWFYSSKNLSFIYISLNLPTFLSFYAGPLWINFSCNQWIRTCMFYTAYGSDKHLPLHVQKLYRRFSLLAFRERITMFLIAQDLWDPGHQSMSLQRPLCVPSCSCFNGQYLHQKKDGHHDVCQMMDNQSSLFAWLKVIACYVRGHRKPVCFDVKLQLEAVERHLTVTLST